jgi:hypothetical protein
VGEPRASEVVGHGERLAPIVADHQPREQGATIVANRRRAAFEQTSYPVGPGRGTGGRCPALDLPDLDTRGDVPRDQPGFALHSLLPSDHEQTVAGETWFEQWCRRA